jgi:hypothetical protein
MLNNWRRRMTETIMPLGGWHTDTGEGLAGRRTTNRVEATVTRTTKDYVLGNPILHKKIKGMNFNKNVIITSKFTSR